MSDIDEPMLGSSGPSPRDQPGDTVEKQIRRLIEMQSYAVLCTQADGQPYGGLVAYSFSPALTQAAFVTLMTTRKYHQLLDCPQVAFVIDNRPDPTAEFMTIGAVTATGSARHVESAEDLSPWLERLTARYSYMADFFRSPSCAVFCVDIVRYFYVTRFQDVSEWIPQQTG